MAQNANRPVPFPVQGRHSQRPGCYIRNVVNECTPFLAPVSRRMSWVCRANGLGPEGGASLAAGLARNCGMLKELVVADNRLGPGVATLVAATMHGGTSQCLRGFGYRAAPKTIQQRHRQDGGSREVCDDGDAAPPSEEGQQSALSPEKFDGGTKETQSRPTSAVGKRSSRANGGNAQPVSFATTRHSSLGLQRTSALASPASRTNGSRPSALAGEAGVGVMGSGSNEFQLLSTSDGAPTTADDDAAAFEEDLGRPQTAGTASG